MDKLLTKFGEKIKSTIEGFDRFIFKGHLRPICGALGMETFLKRNGILNKEYENWINTKSAIIYNDAEAYTQKQCKTKIEYLNSNNIRKDAIAHERQKKTGIESGLIGTWACLETCNSYKALLGCV